MDGVRVLHTELVKDVNDGLTLGELDGSIRTVALDLDAKEEVSRT